MLELHLDLSTELHRSHRSVQAHLASAEEFVFVVKQMACSLIKLNVQRRREKVCLPFYTVCLLKKKVSPGTMDASALLKKALAAYRPHAQRAQMISISSNRDLPLHILVGSEETEEMGRSGVWVRAGLHHHQYSPSGPAQPIMLLLWSVSEMEIHCFFNGTSFQVQIQLSRYLFSASNGLYVIRYTMWPNVSGHLTNQTLMCLADMPFQIYI